MPWPACDARHYQIAALAALLGINLAWVDFNAGALGVAWALAGTLGAQALCTRLWRLPQLELRSALITAFSLSLLLRTDEPALYGLAGTLAVCSKFVLRLEGKHIWNPATFAIVALRYGSEHVWISPGQWGAALWLAALLAFLGVIVLQRSRRTDTAFVFLGVHALLLFARAAYLGDPWMIPLHQLQSGSLLLFAFFMVTDPRTTPDHRLARCVFAAAVAGFAHWLAFFEQMRDALYFSLFLLAPLVPVMDRIKRTAQFSWAATAGRP